MASREVENRIFVGSLSWETYERQLEDAFSRYGKILEAQTETIVLAHPAERALGLHLLQFAEIVEEACSNLLPNVLCEYLYNLSENFTTFYTHCQDENANTEENVFGR